MAGIQARDGASLATLSHRYCGLLRTIIGGVLRSAIDVDDVLQDVTLEIWNRAHTFRSERGNVQAFIVTLARRRAIDRIRRLCTHSRAVDRHRTWVETQAPIFHEAADSAAHAGDLAIILQRLLGELPPPQRQALELTFYRGMSQREIARSTGFPLCTVKTRIELGLRKIRSAVAKIGGADLGHHRRLISSHAGKTPI